MSQLQTPVLKGQIRWPHWPSGPWQHATICWVVFSVSIAAFVLDFLIGARMPAVRPVLHLLGLVPCGFAWLLARSLFRPNAKKDVWPPLMVAALYVICLTLYLDKSDANSGLIGYFSELQTLLGSAMLLLILVEPLDGKIASIKERRFRMAFAAGYVSLVATAFVFALPEFVMNQWAAQATLATMALVSATLAWRYRLRNPLPGAKQAAAKVAGNPALAASILAAVRDKRLYLDPEIKVGALAATLNQPDYKVSQCIVNDLGYRNFNQLVNHYRLELALERLSQAQHADVSILVIALDCGFGSVGPFNRAFKAKTGLTPTAFRKRALDTSSSST